MIPLFLITTVLFAPVLFIVLGYSAFWYLLGVVSNSVGLKTYARNLALGIWDQGLATIWGQAPDISISEALGLAALQHDKGLGGVSEPILFFGNFVDTLFCNRLYCIEPNHIRNSIDPGETFANTVMHWHAIKTHKRIDREEGADEHY